MKKIASIETARKVVGAFLSLSLLIGVCPKVFGQTSDSEKRAQVRLVTAQDEFEAFGRMLKFSRGEEFVKILERELGASQTRATLALLDEKDRNFFKAVFSAHEPKEKSFLEQRFQTAANEPVPAPAAPVKAPSKSRRRAALEIFGGGAFIQNAAFQPFYGESEEPVVKTIDTADGVKTVGEQKNTVETAETIITKGSNADTERTVNDSKNARRYTQTSFEEIYHKKTRGRVRSEKKLEWNFLLAQCPDADGAVTGEASVVIENKTTIANTQTIAIPTQVLSMKVKLKGYVSDEAELTSYDMTGEVVETTTGHDRAKRLGMIDENALSDGTRRFSLDVTGSRIFGPEAEKTGVIREGSTAGLSNAENNRLVDFVDQALPMNLISADESFKSARTNWQNGFCVGVNLAAPKEKLKSGEQVNVTAETVHKLDASKINARLEASGFEQVTPERQEAAPNAVFSVTASEREFSGAEITVKSVSRRGIGTATLNFPKEKPEKKTKPPVKKTPPAKKCTAAWTGKITVEKRKREEKAKPQSGRLVREILVEQETFNVEYNLLGIADTSEGLMNAYFAEARLNYNASRYNELNYAAGKMSCGGKIISSPETRKFESAVTGSSRSRLTVFITSAGEKGILSFGSPEVSGERINTTTYETACPAYDQTNSGVDRSSAPIDVVSPTFDIEFELDANSITQLNGSKTIQNPDGSETLVTWSLTRECR